MPFSHLHDDRTNGAYFRRVADYTYDWESWHDPQGKVVWVNPSVLRITGYSVEECLVMPEYPIPIVAEEDRRQMRMMLKDAVAQKSYNDLEFRIVTTEGVTRWMAVSWQPMYDDEQCHQGFRTSVRDITDRQILKEQLRLYTEHLEQMVQERTAKIAQLEKNRTQMEKLAAMGELAAGIAHEVNNPLAGIRNSFALIKSGMDETHEHYDLLELVDTEIERISSIVHQMYQLYRRNRVASKKLTIERVVEDVLCLLEPVARRARVELVVESPGQPTVATLPEGELKQVLFNLIRNAIQASRAGQSVRVLIHSFEDELQIEIIDRGTGIADDVLPHIFEPFFSTKSRLREGMGLGLSVSRNLIESYGGVIDLQTEVGRGTTFSVTLPRHICEEAA